MSPPLTSTTLRVAAITAQVSIFDWLARRGVVLAAETQQIRCPFHADRSPSARVYAADNVIYCFTCQTRWDVIAAVMTAERLPFLDALAWIETAWGLDTTTPPSLAVALRAQLTTPPSVAVALAAQPIERLLVSRRRRLGYGVYTRALRALDLTVGEGAALPPLALQARLQAVVAVCRSR